MSDWETRETWEPDFQRAIELLNGNSLLEAEELARKILATRPGIVAVRGLLAEILFKAGNFAAATDEFRTVTVRNPNSRRASIGLFKSLVALGMNEQAVAESHRYQSRKPDAEYQALVDDLILDGE